MTSNVAIIISLIVAFAVTGALGFIIIPWLRKLKFGQTILDIGPSWHKSSREPLIWAALCLLSVLSPHLLSAL